MNLHGFVERVEAPPVMKRGGAFRSFRVVKARIARRTVGFLGLTAEREIEGERTVLESYN